jgi:hypothetical protein
MTQPFILLITVLTTLLSSLLLSGCNQSGVYGGAGFGYGGGRYWDGGPGGGSFWWFPVGVFFFVQADPAPATPQDHQRLAELQHLATAEGYSLTPTPHGFHASKHVLLKDLPTTLKAPITVTQPSKDTTRIKASVPCLSPGLHQRQTSIKCRLILKFPQAIQSTQVTQFKDTKAVFKWNLSSNSHTILEVDFNS